MTPRKNSRPSKKTELSKILNIAMTINYSRSILRNLRENQTTEFTLSKHGKTQSRRDTGSQQGTIFDLHSILHVVNFLENNFSL